MEHQLNLLSVPPPHHPPRNLGKLVGPKAPFKQKEIWSIRTRLDIEHNVRKLALFNLAIDSKLRSYDLLRLRVNDVCHGDRVASRAIVMQQKTQRPVRFEITLTTRQTVDAWIKAEGLKSGDCLFPSRVRSTGHLGSRQFARIVKRWAEMSTSMSGTRLGPLSWREVCHATTPFDRL